MDKVQEKSDLVETRRQICGRFIRDPGSYRFVEMADPKTRERW
jgi:precorrin-6A synthase